MHPVWNSRPSSNAAHLNTARKSGSSADFRLLDSAHKRKLTQGKILRKAKRLRSPAGRRSRKAETGRWEAGSVEQVAAPLGGARACLVAGAAGAGVGRDGPGGRHA